MLFIKQVEQNNQGLCQKYEVFIDQVIEEYPQQETDNYTVKDMFITINIVLLEMNLEQDINKKSLYRHVALAIEQNIDLEKNERILKYNIYYI